nr:ribosomal protein L7/L12 [uncultured Campylobacter sp.]
MSKYKLVLVDTGYNNRIEVIRLLLSITNLELSRVQNLIKSVPVVFKENIYMEEAQKIKDDFEKAGAKVSMVKF